MATQEKIAAVAEITGRFRASSAALLTEYRGLTAAQLTTLRRSLGADTTYAVVKNTLGRLAAAEADYPIPAGPAGWLSGPTAVAFVAGDPAQAARTLRDFARTHPALVIKGGVVEGRALSAEQVRRLADLGSRGAQLALAAAALAAVQTRAAQTLTAALAQPARLANALKEIT